MLTVVLVSRLRAKLKPHIADDNLWEVSMQCYIKARIVACDWQEMKSNIFHRQREGEEMGRKKVHKVHIIYNILHKECQ